MVEGEVLELTKAMAQLQGLSGYAADCARDAIMDEIRKVLWNKLSDKEKESRNKSNLALIRSWGSRGF